MSEDQRRINEINTALDVLVPPANQKTIAEYPVNFTTKIVDNATKVIMQFEKNNADVETHLSMFELRKQMYQTLDPEKNTRVLRIPAPTTIASNIKDLESPGNECSIPAPGIEDHSMLIGYGTQMFAEQARFEFYVLCAAPDVLAAEFAAVDEEETSKHSNSDGNRHLLNEDGCDEHGQCLMHYKNAGNHLTVVLNLLSMSRDHGELWIAPDEGNLQARVNRPVDKTVEVDLTYSTIICQYRGFYCRPETGGGCHLELDRTGQNPNSV